MTATSAPGSVNLRPSAVGTRSTRAGTVAGAFSALSLAAVVPHVVQDATLRLFPFSSSSPVGGSVIGAGLALQMLFALGAVKERRGSFVGVLVLSGLWALVAFFNHFGAFLPGDFPGGFPARLMVWGVVVLQGLAALASVIALRATRRTSFSGTGNYNL